MRNTLIAILAITLYYFSGFSGQAYGEEDKNLIFIKKCEKVIRYGDANSAYEASTEHAVVALGLLGDERAVEPLCDVLLNHRNDNVRHHTARALGWIKSEKAVPALEKALSDKYRWTKEAAVRALFDITGKKYEAKYTAAELEEIKKFEEDLKRFELDLPTKQGLHPGSRSVLLRLMIIVGKLFPAGHRKTTAPSGPWFPSVTGSSFLEGWRFTP